MDVLLIILPFDKLLNYAILVDLLSTKRQDFK